MHTETIPHSLTDKKEETASSAHTGDPGRSQKGYHPSTEQLGRAIKALKENLFQEIILRGNIFILTV